MISEKSGTFEKLGRTVKSPPQSERYNGTQGDRTRYTEEVGLHLLKRSDHTSPVNRIEFPRVLPPLLLLLLVLLLLLLHRQRHATTSSRIVDDMPKEGLHIFNDLRRHRRTSSTTWAGMHTHRRRFATTSLNVVDHRICRRKK